MNLKNILLFFLFVFRGFSQNLEQNLETYLKKAMQSNPLLQSEDYLLKNSLNSVGAVGNIPETQFQITPFLMPVQTRVGNQRFKIGMKQTLPWAGILKKEKQAQKLHASAQAYFYERTKAKILLNVKQKYYLLCHLKNKKELLEQSENLLKSIKKIALQNLTTHQTSMSAVLKMNIKQNDIENQIKIVKNNLKAEKKSFQLLLGADKNYFIKIQKEDLKILNENFKNENLKTMPPEKLNFKNHWELRMLAEESESLSALQSIARKKRLPEFSVGMDYIFVEELKKENIFENGQDIFMATIGIKIPIFSKKYSSKEKALRWRRKSLEQKTKHLENTLRDRYQKTQKNLENLKNTLEVLEKNISEIQKIYQVLLADYMGKNSHFQELLDTWQWRLDFELQRSDTQRKYANLIAMMDYLNANENEK